MGIDKQNTSNKDDDGVWYFAIGSMMNPISLANRSLKPKESHPAILRDFRLYFFGVGVAEAIPEKGTSFHGVVHLMSRENMTELDNIERDYERLAATATLYNGKELKVYVYARPDPSIERNPQKDKPPGERYLQIMMDGCRHYGVAQEHIDYLANHEMEPRPTPEEFKCIGVVDDDAPSYSYDEVKEMFEKEGRAVMTFNRKVLELQGVDRDSATFQEFWSISKKFGFIGEVILAKLVYDPKYGRPNKADEVTREHAGYIEDVFCGYVNMTGLAKNWKVIGRYTDQVYKD